MKSVCDLVSEIDIRKYIAYRRTLLADCFHAGILLGLFYPEDGSDIFLRNIT
jgi:hypothetical protein